MLPTPTASLGQYKNKSALFAAAAPGNYRGAGPVLPGSPAYEAVKLCHDAHYERGDYPADPPASFEVRTHDDGVGWGWHALWPDARHGGWSYKRGFNSSPEVTRFQNAIRTEIEDQRPTTQRGHHAHHAGKSFAVICQEFFGDMVHPVQDWQPGKGYLLIDRDLASRWQDHHREAAQWEVLTVAEHKAAHRKSG